MKEPKRLLSHGATDFERQLLRAVVNERPSALLRSRMQRGLGLVGPLAWASTVKAMLGSVAGKVTGVLALGVLAAAGVTAVELIPHSSGDAAAPAASVREEMVAPAPRAELSAARDAVDEPQATAGDVTPSTPAAAEPPPSSASAAPEPAAAAEANDEEDQKLREEIALIDAARSALERGDRQAARNTLRSYRERFPAGVLAREANVLRRRAEPPRAHPRPER